MGHLKRSEEVKRELGEGLYCDPDSISGSVNSIKGNGHLSFDLIGSKSKGNLVFAGSKISPHEWKSDRFILTLPDKSEILL